MVNILYSFDNKFWKLALASIYSVLKNKNPDTVYSIYCMVKPKTKGKRKIKKLVEKFGCNLIWREIKKNENPYNDFDYIRWSPVIFYRLFSHIIFPNLKKIIYLDSDTIVVSDLTQLYKTDIGDCIIAGVPDYGAILKTDRHINELLETTIKSGIYINSGVLLIDCLKMPDFVYTDYKLFYPDQDIINIGLDGHIFKLPMRYNTLPGDNLLKSTDDDLPPVIYHYYSLKPYYHPDKKSYILFERLVAEIGLKPIDFIKHEEKYNSKKTNFNFIRIVGKKIKIFGITIIKI